MEYWAIMVSFSNFFILLFIVVTVELRVLAICFVDIREFLDTSESI